MHDRPTHPELLPAAARPVHVVAWIHQDITESTNRRRRGGRPPRPDGPPGPPPNGQPPAIIIHAAACWSAV